MTAEQPIRAAGVVLWRGDERDPEVAVVHRPRYDDWTFPKGKVRPGEHEIAAALRETLEETGHAVVLGRRLPTARYPHKGRPKQVEYWAARPVSGHFAPGDEVDRLEWVPASRAPRLLTYERDAGLVEALLAAPLRTVPLLLVRHGSAGSREEWEGDDDLRPLDAEGLAQARTLATVLSAYAPELLLSSPSRRCVQTLEPYGTGIRLEPLLSERQQDPVKTPELVRRLRVPAVVSSHGKVLPHLIESLTGREHHLAKGGLAVLHRMEDRVEDGVVAMETYLDGQNG
ncbi:NUDIX hydrolase [Thermoactinospora rubra]|uniref:NUDIX hydrolase n=1 Tax=Thermoactinospora rubra TaxID=1088767 RepID=UPI001F0B5654|nr:NUDIX hydrolase [Thermoactinospora rubra]